MFSALVFTFCCFLLQTGLTEKQLKSLDEIFESVYKAKYPIVGHMQFEHKQRTDEL